MREIKFRGKRVDNGEWVIGDLMWHKRFMELKPYIKEKDTGQIEWFEVKPHTVGQYTGLKDRREKEIYRNDIVKCAYGIGKVVFNAGCFMVEWIGDGEAYMEFLFSKDGMYRREGDEVFEVIGNIHDNQELLNQNNKQ